VTSLHHYRNGTERNRTECLPLALVTLVRVTYRTRVDVVACEGFPPQAIYTVTVRVCGRTCGSECVLVYSAQAAASTAEWFGLLCLSTFSVRNWIISKVKGKVDTTL
jgi:hypothetical protein